MRVNVFPNLSEREVQHARDEARHTHVAGVVHSRPQRTASVSPRSWETRRRPPW